MDKRMARFLVFGVTLLIVLFSGIYACATQIQQKPDTLKEQEEQNEHEEVNDETANEVDDTIETKTYKFLLENGFSPIQASAILAEIKAESNFNCQAVSVNNMGYGLMQWGHYRKQYLQEFADKIDKPVDEFETQLLFMLEELNPESEYYELKYSYEGYKEEQFWNAQTIEEAVKSFCMLYAKPHTVDFESRLGMAQEYYETFK